MEITGGVWHNLKGLAAGGKRYERRDKKSG
jgi:hypothetical protein